MPSPGAPQRRREYATTNTRVMGLWPSSRVIRALPTADIGSFNSTWPDVIASLKRSPLVDLTTKLENPPGRTPKGKSVIDVWAEQRPDHNAIINAAKSSDWGHVALLDVLAAEGCPRIATTTFAMWRKKHGWNS